MKQYEYLEHTSEAKFAAWGKTIEEAFSNAAIAMENIIVETEKVKPKIKKKIVIETKHTKALLYDFLQELLVLFDSERFALHKVETITIHQKGSDFHLHATVSGDDAQHYEMHSGVKSVTYNEMEITEKKGVWKVVVVLDV
ncbi:MAG: archease [Nanoarchaeota archaeon]